jgi:hypothetical protein
MRILAGLQAAWIALNEELRERLCDCKDDRTDPGSLGREAEVELIVFALNAGDHRPGRQMSVQCCQVGRSQWAVGDQASGHAEQELAQASQGGPNSRRMAIKRRQAALPQQPGQPLGVVKPVSIRAEPAVVVLLAVDEIKP